jgi:multidrug efflux pump subunit AcrB
VSSGSNAPDQQFTLTVDSPLSTPEDFGQLVVATASDGTVTRLADVARIELGSQDYSVNSYLDGDNAVAVLVFARPGTNGVETAHAVQQTMFGWQLSPKCMHPRSWLGNSRLAWLHHHGGSGHHSLTQSGRALWRSCGVP